MALTGTNILGVQSSVTQLAANQMPDIDRVLYRLDPFQTPILQYLYFMKGNKAEKVINQNGKFSWFEDEFYPRATTVTNITGGATSEDNITVADGTIFQSGDILLIEKTEQLVYVDSIASSQVDITILDGATNITAVADDSYIRIIGSRNNELSTPRTAVNTKEIEVYNYLNIFNESVKTSGRYQAGDHYTNGKSHADQVRQRMLEMKIQQETWMAFSPSYGTIATDLSSTARFSYGKGFLGLVTTHVDSYSGAMTEAGLVNFLKAPYNKGGNKKVMFAGTDWLIDFQNAIRDANNTRFNLTSDTKVAGLRVMEYMTPFNGTLKIVWNPMFEGKFSYYGFLVDESTVKMRYMANDERGSRKLRMTEMPVVGDYKETWLLSDIGLQLANEEKCGIYYKL